MVATTNGCTKVGNYSLILMGKSKIVLNFRLLKILLDSPSVKCSSKPLGKKCHDTGQYSVNPYRRTEIMGKAQKQTSNYLEKAINIKRK